MSTTLTRAQRASKREHHQKPLSITFVFGDEKHLLTVLSGDYIQSVKNRMCKRWNVNPADCVLLLLNSSEYKHILIPSSTTTFTDFAIKDGACLILSYKKSN